MNRVSGNLKVLQCIPASLCTSVVLGGSSERGVGGIYVTALFYVVALTTLIVVVQRAGGGIFLSVNKFHLTQEEVDSSRNLAIQPHPNNGDISLQIGEKGGGRHCHSPVATTASHVRIPDNNQYDIKHIGNLHNRPPSSIIVGGS